MAHGCKSFEEGAKAGWGECCWGSVWILHYASTGTIENALHFWEPAQPLNSPTAAAEFATGAKDGLVLVGFGTGGLWYW